MKLHSYQGVEHADILSMSYMGAGRGRKKVRTGHLFKLKGREAYLFERWCEQNGLEGAEALCVLLARAVGDVEEEAA